MLPKRTLWILRAGLCVLASLLYAAAADAGTYSVVYRFSGPDGKSPYGPLLPDAAGNLYGVTADGGAHHDGVVFELSPPKTKGGSWTESVLHTFARGPGGAAPQPGLVWDHSGNLYGETYEYAGDYVGGTVFELSPTRNPTKWRYSVLLAFGGPDSAGGSSPVGNIVIDAAGNLYGATRYGGTGVCTHDDGPCGVIFSLSPPTGSAPWKETVLHNFTGIPDGDTPATGVTLDANGNVYGTTVFGGTGHCTDGEGLTTGCGIAFELTFGKSGWNERILREFTPKVQGPDGPMVLVPNRALLAPLTYDVVALMPRKAPNDWRMRLLYQFPEGIAGTHPGSALLPGGEGGYYGTTTASGIEGYGTVYRLAPAPGDTNLWQETTLHTFGGGLNGDMPYGGLVFGKDGALYGTASSFGVRSGFVFRLAP